MSPMLRLRKERTETSGSGGETYPKLGPGGKGDWVYCKRGWGGSGRKSEHWSNQGLGSGNGGEGVQKGGAWGTLWAGPGPLDGLNLPPSVATPGAQSTCSSQALPVPSHFRAPVFTPIALIRGAKTSQVLPGNGLISTYC